MTFLDYKTEVADDRNIENLVLCAIFIYATAIFKIVALQKCFVCCCFLLSSNLHSHFSGKLKEEEEEEEED